MNNVWPDLSLRWFCLFGIIGVLVDLDHIFSLVSQGYAINYANLSHAGKPFHFVGGVILWYLAGLAWTSAVGLLAYLLFDGVRNRGIARDKNG